MDDDAARNGACSQDDEAAAFAHLEELLDALPAMRDKGARLASARHAEAVVRAAGERDACRSMLDFAEEQLARAEEALAEARASGSDADADACRRAVLFAASLRGFRVGPAQNAARALDGALAAGSFSGVQDALAACLEEDELGRIEAEIDAYQKDYSKTLALCERIEAVSGGVC